jgi:hypothetical protein
VPPREFLQLYEAGCKLRKLRSCCSKKITKDLGAAHPALTPFSRSLPRPVYRATLYHDSLLLEYDCFERDFNKWATSLCDEILAFMEAVQKSQDHIEARCNTAKLAAHMQECYNSRPARSYQEKRTRIRQSTFSEWFRFS